MMSFSSYFVLSSLVVAGVMAHAYVAHEQFYPAVVYLSTDKMCLAVMYNFAFALFLLFGKVLLKLFIGPLRDLEVEQLVDSGRGFLADTILFLVFYAPTIDNREVGTVYLIQYICCVIFMKVFHLTTQIRVSHMFEIGFPTLIVNIKLVALMCLLLTIDLVALQYFYHIASRTSTFFTWILFEALTMSTVVFVSICKYSVHMVDLRLENGWPGKSVCLFYIDLVHDVATMTLFLVFMLTFFVQNPSRLPIYMMADVIQVARKLAQRLRSFRRYRRISANMEERFADATEEQIKETQLCVICRDSLCDCASKPKRLECGHVFHIDCLRSWLVMQQVCPTCRAEISPDGNANSTAQHEMPGRQAPPAQAPEMQAPPPINAPAPQGERSVDPPASASAATVPGAQSAPNAPQGTSPSSASSSQPSVGMKPPVSALPGGVGVLPPKVIISASSSNQGASILLSSSDKLMETSSGVSQEECLAYIKQLEEGKRFLQEQAAFWMAQMQTIERSHPQINAETSARLLAQHSLILGQAGSPQSGSPVANSVPLKPTSANDLPLASPTSLTSSSSELPVTNTSSPSKPTNAHESISSDSLARATSLTSSSSVEDQMAELKRLQREQWERKKSSQSMGSIESHDEAKE